MSNEKISSALGIRPMSEIDENEKILPAEAQPIAEVKPQAPSTELAIGTEIDQENLADIETVRDNINDVMSTGQEAMKEMLEIAKQSEQPRAFEVVSTLMKTLLDANKDYADISTKRKFAKEEINGPKEAAQTNVTNNNLIVSTSDLLRMIKGEPEDG